MAKLTVKMPDDFLMKLSRLAENTDAIAEKVLQAGGEVVLDKVRANLQAVVGANTKIESRSTGELAGSIGLSPVKVTREGNYDVKVGFREPRSDGGSNAKIANILEYGRSGQPPKPFLAPAKRSSRSQVIDTMKKKLDEEIAAL